MGTPINEPIRTGVVFDYQSVKPVWFMWGARRYPIREVTQRWQTRQGTTPILHLGVTDGVSCFELAFNQDTLTWRLISAEADWCE
jgi:hypothetical protein